MAQPVQLDVARAFGLIRQQARHPALRTQSDAANGLDDQFRAPRLDLRARCHRLGTACIRIGATPDFVDAGRVDAGRDSLRYFRLGNVLFSLDNRV